MSTITFKGGLVHTSGSLPEVGAQLPDFTVTKNDLSELSLRDLHDRKIIINMFPSLDTATCAKSVRRFNEEGDHIHNLSILCVSADLPFAQSRFCATENLHNVITASVFRNPAFGEKMGVTITDGPLKGLLSRAIVVADEKGKIIYTEQVHELTNEPNYEHVLSIIR